MTLMESTSLYSGEKRPGSSFARKLFYLLVGFLALAGLSSLGAKLLPDSGGSGEKVGLVEVAGMITDSRDVVEQISQYRRDDSIRGIILRIDSPGGAVAPSQEIYDEVLRTREEKKIIASLGSMAASGGYYIASSANHIIANPGTLMGSIGVVFASSNIEELIGKIGLKPVVIKSGKFKDAGSPVRPMTEEEQSLLQGVVNDVHSQFVQAIVKGRDLQEAEVKKIADGRVFTGKKALELKLIDQLGGLEDSIQWMQDTLSLDERPKIIQQREEVGLLSLIFGKAPEWISASPSPLPAWPTLQFLWPFGNAEWR